MDKSSKTKGILSAILMFIFCLIFVPVIFALFSGMFVFWVGNAIIPILSIANVFVILLAVPLAFWAGWKRYKRFNG